MLYRLSYEGTGVQIQGSWVPFPLRPIKFFYHSMSVCDEKLYVRTFKVLCSVPRALTNMVYYNIKTVWHGERLLKANHG